MLFAPARVHVPTDIATYIMDASTENPIVRLSTGRNNTNVFTSARRSYISEKKKKKKKKKKKVI
jgi:hypothetical protein